MLIEGSIFITSTHGKQSVNVKPDEPHKDNPDRIVILVAEPGEVRDGMQALLAAIPKVATYELDTDEEFSPALLERLSTGNATLIIVDFDLPTDQLNPLLKKIEAQAPKAMSVMLVDNAEQEEEAASLEPDMVLAKGVPAHQLFHAITELLNPTDFE